MKVRQTKRASVSAPKPRPLRTLQRWLARVVVHPATAAVALRLPAAAAMVAPRDVAGGHVLTPNARRSAAQSLDVYNGAYLARLVEVLQGDYGGLQAALGAAAFHRLAAAYLARHPSRHPNLNRLGRSLPGFVRTRRGLPQRAFLHELAALELAVTLAFDAPEFEPLATAAIAALPPARQARLRFRANPSLQLLACRHPVDVWYQAWKEGASPALPAAAPSWLAVYRRDDRVFRSRLQRNQYRVLQALVAGRPLGEALALARATDPVGPWFAGFAADGLFVAVR